MEFLNSKMILIPVVLYVLLFVWLLIQYLKVKSVNKYQYRAIGYLKTLLNEHNIEHGYQDIGAPAEQPKPEKERIEITLLDDSLLTLFNDEITNFLYWYEETDSIDVKVPVDEGFVIVVRNHVKLIKFYGNYESGLKALHVKKGELQ